MKIESTGFQVSDLTGFSDELMAHEKELLAERLDAVSARVRAAGGRVADGDRPDSAEGWNPREVLAHIAVLSKFYGMLTYKIGTGARDELDLIGNVHLRDVLGEQLSHLPAVDVVGMAVADHARTSAYLRSCAPSDLRRVCRLSHGETMTASDIARLPLIAHLELHAAQLERSLE